MKQISSIVCKAIILLIILISSVKASSQINHSQVVSFMQGKGWAISSDNNFRYAKATNQTTLEYYNFDSCHKYAIVAFSRNKEVKDFYLEVQKSDGQLYSKRYNTHLPANHLPFKAAVYCFNPGDNQRFGIRINTDSSNPEYSTQCHYIIFYK
jgi:hypothetical protein